MRIKFYHRAFPESIYELIGNMVYWSPEGGHETSGRKYYPDSEIEHWFATDVWVKVEEEEDEVDDEFGSDATAGETKPIASDGGSSTYYDIGLPLWLVAAIGARAAEGCAYIKTEELIEVAFNSDFNFGTAFKSMVRGFGVTQGAGKAGNDLGYEMNKVRYYADRIEEVQERVA